MALRILAALAALATLPALAPTAAADVFQCVADTYGYRNYCYVDGGSCPPEGHCQYQDHGSIGVCNAECAIIVCLGAPGSYQCVNDEGATEDVLSLVRDEAEGIVDGVPVDPRKFGVKYQCHGEVLPCVFGVLA